MAEAKLPRRCLTRRARSGLNARNDRRSKTLPTQPRNPPGNPPRTLPGNPPGNPPGNAMLPIVPAFGRIGEENAFAVLARATALARSGRDIINLGIGQPDFPTPAHVVEAG